MSKKIYIFENATPHVMTVAVTLNPFTESSDTNDGIIVDDTEADEAVDIVQKAKGVDYKCISGNPNTPPPPPF